MSDIPIPTAESHEPAFVSKMGLGDQRCGQSFKQKVVRFAGSDMRRKQWCGLCGREDCGTVLGSKTGM
jgi:hypothetical protein